MKRVMENVVDLYKSMKEREKELSDKVDELNSLQNDFNHILELGSLDAIEIMKMSSFYRKQLRLRRDYLEELSEIRRYLGVFKKHSDFFQELEYVSKKEVDEEKRYYARSTIGQKLIDEYCSDKDDLMKSPGIDEFRELKQVMES